MIIEMEDMGCQAVDTKIKQGPGKQLESSVVLVLELNFSLVIVFLHLVT